MMMVVNMDEFRSQSSLIARCSLEIAIIFSFLLTMILLVIILTFICYARNDLERKVLECQTRFLISGSDDKRKSYKYQPSNSLSNE